MLWCPATIEGVRDSRCSRGSLVTLCSQYNYDYSMKMYRAVALHTPRNELSHDAHIRMFNNNEMLTLPLNTPKNITRLTKNFYARDTHVVAKELLGKIVVRTWRKTLFTVRITEVESYVGEDDRASHARFGRTKRNNVMFGPAGYAYVYLIYGVYSMLNVVTERDGFPAAVLIRAAVLHEELGIKNKESRVLNGPGIVCRDLHITRAQNGIDLTTNTGLYIADDGFVVSPADIQAAPRIGIDYADQDALLPWRYVLKTSS